SHEVRVEAFGEGAANLGISSEPVTSYRVFKQIMFRYELTKKGKTLWIRLRTTLNLARRTTNRCGLPMRRSANIAMSARFFTARRRSIVCYFRSSRKGSRAARRRFTLSIQNCATSTYSDFPQAASTSLRLRRMRSEERRVGKVWRSGWARG